MRGLHRIISRLECLRLNTQLSVNKFRPSSYYKRAFCTPSFDPETADMGKDKVPYQLKTPKGTKDCTRSSSIHHLVDR